MSEWEVSDATISETADDLGHEISRKPRPLHGPGPRAYEPVGHEDIVLVEEPLTIGETVASIELPIHGPGPRTGPDAVKKPKPLHGPGPRSYKEPQERSEYRNSPNRYSKKSKAARRSSTSRSKR